MLFSQPNATALASLAETFEGVDACATWTTLWCNDCTATAWELIVVPQVKFGRPNEDMEPLLPRDLFSSMMLVEPLPQSLRDDA